MNPPASVTTTTRPGIAIAAKLIAVLENTVDELSARVDALEGNEIRSVAYLDENLRKSDMANSKFIKVEYDGGMELLKIERSNGYAG
jgi:hypothetical protein